MNKKDEPKTTFAKSIILKPLNHYVQEKNAQPYITRSIDSRSRIHTLPSGVLNDPNVEHSKECSTLDLGIGRRKQSKNKCEIFPMRKLEPVRLMKRPSSSSLSASYLKMASSRTKPTDKLFSEKDNIRLVERLLMAKATKEYRKDEHNKFYTKQKNYSKNIQISKSLIFKNSREKTKPWVDF